MKTLNDYMKMPYRMEIVEDKEEGGYVVCRIAQVSQLKGDGEQRQNKEPFIGGFIPHIRDPLVGKCVIFPFVA